MGRPPYLDAFIEQEMQATHERQEMLIRRELIRHVEFAIEQKASGGQRFSFNDVATIAVNALEDYYKTGTMPHV